MTESVNSTLASVRHLLIDLDGVLYTGNVPIEGAVDFIPWLRRQQIDFRLVTNNATLTPSQFAAKMRAMGFSVNPGEVFSSSLATAAYLQGRGAAGQSAYVVGEIGLQSALEDAGLVLTDQDPAWVVVGLDRQLTYDKLATAALAIRGGAVYIGSNPDTSLPSERGLLPGAGAIQAAITAATGIAPIVVGKPQRLMLDLAREALGGTASDTAMLGDRLDTDIQGAAAAGLPSILVLTGVSTRAELAGSAVQPQVVVDNLRALMAAWPESAR